MQAFLREGSRPPHALALLAHLRSERCVFRCTCPRKTRISIFLPSADGELCEAFVRIFNVPSQKNIPQGEIPLRDIEYAVTRWQ